MIGIIEVYGSMLLRALGQTLLLTLLSLLFAMVIGMIFGLMNVGHNRVLNLIGTIYTYTLFIDTHDVTLQNLTVENASGDSATHGQAIADRKSVV